MGLVHGKFEKGRLINTFKGPFSEKYEVMKVLGSGAGGKAYLVAPKAPTGRTKAIRYVAKESHDVEDTGELKKEFEFMSSLDHPNIVKVIELVDGDDWDGESQRYRPKLYVVSEFAAGLDLFKHIQEMNKHAGVNISEEWISGVFKKAMKGVSYLHGVGIVHNDLKPDNILVLDEFRPSQPMHIPEVVVTDFGRASRSAFEFGDPRYQAPEKWAEDAAVGKDAKIDVWSMGVTLFELLSGGLIAFLYEPCTLEEILGEKGERLKDMVYMSKDPADMSYCEGISPEASDLVLKMLQKAQGERVDSRGVLLHAWLDIHGHELSKVVLQRSQLTAVKREAHSMLLQAMTVKMEREHLQHVQQVFDAVDTDKDGLIALDEFKRSCSELGLDLDATTKVFEAADTDKSGSLTFNEFATVTFDWKSLETAELDDKLRDLFRSLDTDNDGGITMQELAVFFSGVLLKGQIKATFHLMDRNKDGKVSISELEDFVFKPITPQDLETYSQAMEAAPVELCEQIRPESVAALLVSGFLVVAEGASMLVVSLRACQVW
eukprot:CAMPEP_0179098730 /NCGR_PEP_ID=MMETSP0796-20121207/45513_1 /TAXON_ID=73915 /ORGANISM="Pyrodinium bahamense, Strain pbaha01" /LENGTH=546 /DNA_ID=CAMNT_0020796515 /DNA_START=62 /DNA_END=1700 /DNA_ORIENTATION=-